MLQAWLDQRAGTIRGPDRREPHRSEHPDRRRSTTSKRTERSRREPVSVPPRLGDAGSTTVRDHGRGHDDEYVVDPAADPRRTRASSPSPVWSWPCSSSLVAAARRSGRSRQIDPPGEPGPSIGDDRHPDGFVDRRHRRTCSPTKGVDHQRDACSGTTPGGRTPGPGRPASTATSEQDMSFDEAISVLDEGPVPPSDQGRPGRRGPRASSTRSTSIAEQIPNVTVDQLERGARLGPGPLEVQGSRERPELGGVPLPRHLPVRGGRRPRPQILADDGHEDGRRPRRARLRPAETLQGRSPYELITIASLIEKEAGHARRRAGQDRPGHLQPPRRRRSRSASTPRCCTAWTGPPAS